MATANPDAAGETIRSIVMLGRTGAGKSRLVAAIRSVFSSSDAPEPKCKVVAVPQGRADVDNRRWFMESLGGERSKGKMEMLRGVLLYLVQSTKSEEDSTPEEDSGDDGEEGARAAPPPPPADPCVSGRLVRALDGDDEALDKCGRLAVLAVEEMDEGRARKLFGRAEDNGRSDEHLRSFFESTANEDDEVWFHRLYLLFLPFAEEGARREAVQKCRDIKEEQEK